LIEFSWHVDGKNDDRKIVFSGDQGRPGAPFLTSPKKVQEADYQVLESTYGEREHGDRSRWGKELFEAVLETVENGGNVIIPAFAVGRAQEVLYELNPYAESGAFKGIKCFVDRPLVVSAGEIYSRHPACFNAETRHLIEMGDDPLAFPGISYTRSKDESKAMNSVKEPHVIISASGMCTGAGSFTT